MTAAARRLVTRATIAAGTTLALAWVPGGQALLGRVDPALAVPLLPWPMLLIAWWQRDAPRRTRLYAAFLALTLVIGAQAAMTLWLANQFSLRQIVLVIVAGAGAALIADRLVQWRGRPTGRTNGRGVRIVLVTLFILGWFAVAHAALARLYHSPSAAGPPATMLTSLPLRWAGEGDMAVLVAQGADDDPALARLEQSLPLRLVDGLTDSPPPPGGALFLAHPYALAPHDLVAVDAFVRKGGRAVILADALSAWPVARPLGDPRNPPITSLLTPLLDHWGIMLGAAPKDDSAPHVVDIDGSRLRLFSAGRFDRLPPTCRAYGERYIAFCRIGRGKLWLVGDADLLFPSLWRPLVPGASHLRRADTMEWLTSRLTARAPRAWLTPLWIGSRAG